MLQHAFLNLFTHNKEQQQIQGLLGLGFSKTTLAKFQIPCSPTNHSYLNTAQWKTCEIKWQMLKPKHIPHKTLCLQALRVRLVMNCCCKLNSSCCPITSILHAIAQVPTITQLKEVSQISAEKQ
jgi:hypothetical protein